MRILLDFSRRTLGEREYLPEQARFPVFSTKIRIGSFYRSLLLLNLSTLKSKRSNTLKASAV